MTYEVTTTETCHQVHIQTGVGYNILQEFPLSLQGAELEAAIAEFIGSLPFNQQ